MFDKMAAVGHFGHIRNSLSITFLAILDQCRINFLNLFTKWPPAPILDVQNSLSIAFLAILFEYGIYLFLKLLQNGRRRPFWISEIHFRLHF